MSKNMDNNTMVQVINENTVSPTSSKIYDTTYTGNGTYTTHQTWNAQKSRGLRVDGDAEFNGDVEINGGLILSGKNLVDTLDAINTRLGILMTNSDLEAEFSELQALGDAYRRAEKKFNEQKKIIDILKK